MQKGSLAYGETPSYEGDTPTKPANAEWKYTFAGWEPEITEVTGDATYTATYTKEVRKYTVTIYSHYENGNPKTDKVILEYDEVLSSQHEPYGIP